MPEKLMRWNGSEWVEVVCVNRQEVKDTVILTALNLDLQDYYETEKVQNISIQYLNTNFQDYYETEEIQNIPMQYVYTTFTIENI